MSATEITWSMSRVRTIDAQREVIAHATIEGHRITRIRVHPQEAFMPPLIECFYAAGDNAACSTIEEALGRARQLPTA